MKKLSCKTKILLLMAAFAVMAVPSVVSADTLFTGTTWTKTLHNGEQVLTVGGAACDKIQFIVENGDPSGKNRMSSVKVALLDAKGNVKEVIISPSQFNQRVGFQSATFPADGLFNDWRNPPKFLVKVGGKSTGYIKLTINKKKDYTPPPGPTWLN